MAMKRETKGSRLTASEYDELVDEVSNKVDLVQGEHLLTGGWYQVDGDADIAKLGPESEFDFPFFFGSDDNGTVTGVVDPDGRAIKFGKNSSGHQYSTTEKVTGDLWIDGSDIYEITVDGLAIPVNSVIEVLPGIAIRQLLENNLQLLAPVDPVRSLPINFYDGGTVIRSWVDARGILNVSSAWDPVGGATISGYIRYIK